MKRLLALHHVVVLLRLENDVTGKLLECMKVPGAGAPREPCQQLTLGAARGTVQHRACHCHTDILPSV